MALDIDAEGASRGSGKVRILPEDGIVRLDEFHELMGCSTKTVRKWVHDGMPLIRHRMKAHYVRISRWLEWMEQREQRGESADDAAAGRRPRKGK